MAPRTLAQGEYPNLSGLCAFTAAANYMSLPGYLRWMTFKDQNCWLTYAEGAADRALSAKGPGLSPMAHGTTWQRGRASSLGPSVGVWQVTLLLALASAAARESSAWRDGGLGVRAGGGAGGDGGLLGPAGRDGGAVAAGMGAREMGLRAVLLGGGGCGGPGGARGRDGHHAGIGSDRTVGGGSGPWVSPPIWRVSPFQRQARCGSATCAKRQRVIGGKCVRGRCGSNRTCGISGDRYRVLRPAGVGDAGAARGVDPENRVIQPESVASIRPAWTDDSKEPVGATWESGRVLAGPEELSRSALALSVMMTEILAPPSPRRLVWVVGAAGEVSPERWEQYYLLTSALEWRGSMRRCVS